MTPAAYARSRGLNRSTVSRQIKSGVITLVDGLVDPEAADRDRATKLDLARQKKTIQGAETTEVENEFAGDEPTVASVVQQLHSHGLALLDRIGRALKLTPGQRRSAHFITIGWLDAVLGDTALRACGPNGPQIEYLPPESVGRQQLAESDAAISAAEKALGQPDSGPKIERKKR